MQMLPVALTCIAGIYLAACIVLFGRKTPNYRHAQHTISELGEIGAPYQRQVALRVFLPVGLALIGTAATVLHVSLAAGTLALCLAAGYLISAFFPCDPKSPVSGTVRQAIHNLGGGIEYIGGGAALIAVSHSLGDIFRLCGYVAFAAAVLLTIMPATSMRGLVQRIAETTLFGALAVVTVRLYDGA